MRRIFGNERGFTFVEIMVALVLLGIISAVVIATGLKSGADSASLTGQSRELISDIRMIRTMAQEESKHYGILIDQTKPGEYYLCEVDVTSVPHDYSNVTEIVVLDREITISATLSSDLKFSFTPEGNAWDENGNTDNGPYRIILRDSSGAAKQIEVNDLGLVELK
ncbi:prepilin-type N-terminal cleavage/methylation domain-containing protein [Phosphitispora fastidiosa]|uniref:prepilin-type N-terminal cleavage/methylation domain-containing protein n=1 Tax=Phosphitispora fastidiosa TaxID=2837202 RepID=UPI001E3FF6F7|nr:prepilin-type N-terminal cleavage/methylation domain-containing protein [Phosphitispora fastidiosa]MBU7008764.1 prepilin-type N-terminal cleavage/methylation domain-containing protein [Phosphitispora fastidiosa]